MKVVIAGAGVVGYALAEELAVEVDEVVVIEKDNHILQKIISQVDVTGLAGNAASYDNLIEAGIEDADLFIAVTQEDEINIISSIMAKHLGVRHTVVRVRNPEYTKHSDFMRQDMGISFMINPDWEVARDIARILRFPEASGVEYFAHGQAIMIEMRIFESSVLTGMSIIEFGQRYNDILVVAIERGAEAIVPTGTVVLESGDLIQVIGAKPDVNTFYLDAGYSSRGIESTLILGENRIAYYLVDFLQQMNMQVKIICEKYTNAQEMAEAYPKAIVVVGDQTDQDFLHEERIEQYDAVITLSEIDEENILNSLYALSLDIPKVITKVSRVKLLDLLKDIQLQSVVTPKYRMVDLILRFVRSLRTSNISNIEALMRVADNKIEVLQFLVKDGSQITNVPLRDLSLKPNTLVAFIIRDDELLIPRGEDVIKMGDHIIIAAAEHYHFEKLDDVMNPLIGE